VLSGRCLSHKGAAVGAMGDEVFDDKIILGDHVLNVAAPVGKGASDDLGCCAPAFRSRRDTPERRIMADQSWVEMSIDGGQVTVTEQGGDELLDDSLVSAVVSHGAMLERS